ncbi:ribonuclease H-like protein, partial [Lophium mytilinum]
ITIAELKALLARIGSPANGTRPVLQARLAQDLKTPRLPISIGNTTSTLGSEGISDPSRKDNGTTRLLSVDMGIKNLAFCVADVKLELKSTTKKPASPKGHMSTIAWRRIDVAWETAQKSSDPAPKDSDGEDAPDDPFHPRNLAATAYALLTRILLPYEPDIILIERQRYRSGGGAAIQEWTVRVNMLEGMLWAILESLRQTASHSKSTKKEFPSVFDVSPARVGAFWVDPEKVPRVRTKAVLGAEGEVIGTEETSVLARGKVKKPQKVKLVRSWLSGPNFSSHPSGGSKEETQRLESIIPLTFSFSEEAEATRLTLCSPASRAKPKTKIPVSGNPRKFDDLADCFLQAAAWVAWEGARVKI